MTTNETVLSVIGTIAGAAALVGVVFFVSQCSINNTNRFWQAQQDCIKAGGTWMPQSGDYRAACLMPGAPRP